MAKVYMLTTNDNPFDPFEQFIPWFMFDIEKGYNTCGRLMRIAKITDDMSEVEMDRELERAMNILIKYDFTDTYIKTSQEESVVENH